jgi:pilus assembly protein CpaF
VSALAYDSIRSRVLAELEHRRLRPDADVAEVRAEVRRAVDDYERRARLGEEIPLAEPESMTDRVLRAITDFGALTELLSRRDVEEIFVEGARVSYLDGSGRLRGLAVPTSEDENRQVVERMLATTDRQLNAKHPMVQARVLGGSARLTAAIPPVGDQLSATLRRYVVRNVSLADLASRDSLSDEAAGFLAALMSIRSRVTVSGEPGAGKTTLAGALLAAAPPGHCVRSCEEIRELAVPLAHGSYYEVRPPGLDGTGEITLRDLVKFVLAMRPDRIVVGEVRGAEAFELSRAVNAGCGFLCTVHANSAAEALDALVNAALMAGENVTERVVRKVFSASLDVVVHLDRDDLVANDAVGIRRQVMEIAAVVPAMRDDFTVEPIFVRERLGAPLCWTGVLPSRLAGRLERATGASGLRELVAAGPARDAARRGRNRCVRVPRRGPGPRPSGGAPQMAT